MAANRAGVVGMEDCGWLEVAKWRGGQAEWHVSLESLSIVVP